jgi:dephospho-CoA kinase
MREVKKVIGLTGGIASGKSTVGKLFKGFNVAVIDADLLAREVVKPGTEGLREVVAHFGDQVLAQDGTLDRVKLGARIFTDEAARKELDGILHPRIASLAEERIRAAQDTPTPYVVYEAALLVELGMYREFSKLVVVSADPELQVKRVMKRNGLTESEARDRLASQFPLAQKLAVADYVIKNDNNRDALLARTREVHEKLLGL